MEEKRIVFVDTEVQAETGKVLEYGAITEEGAPLRTASTAAFSDFLRGADYLCGHNLIAHDLQYLKDPVAEACTEARMIDTLHLSPLLFPTRPYHHLLKDDKLQTEELNNPLNDAIKARELFWDEVTAFEKLEQETKRIYAGLLEDRIIFSGFFHFLGAESQSDRKELAALIRTTFHGAICEYANLEQMMETSPAELAYTLALIRANDQYSITPPWVARSYPRVENLMKLLRGMPCGFPCAWCDRKLDVRKRLTEIFGFPAFRQYEGVPLQEEAARAAVEGKSLLAVFPTGGGKSITFQLPALMAGETDRGLTVVISPLQSLMKDQVDHLEAMGIADAVMINGLQDPMERKSAIDRVANGLASILYISPESLRSRTVESLLQSRNVVRFVIDEAHCFSAWGQDFRVDYLYIGDFIRKLQEMKNRREAIPVSCFTATAKQKVISDIQEYFRKKLGIELELFTTRIARKNLRYAVLFKDNNEEKYLEVRNLIEARKCPAIVYVSRVRRTQELARRLQEDGIAAEAYNGRMDANDKIRIQEDFLNDRLQVIVATSAFGMGVDKKDVGLVIHFDISDSLESYVQEAGRAGRDASLNAECYVLFNDDDLDKHFILLNQTKLSISEIQQVWRAVKEMSRNRDTVNCSALEIARQAGWDETSPQMETRVTSAIAALENAGYLERGRNVPHIYASSIQVANMMEASNWLDRSTRLAEGEREDAKRIVKYLISRKNTCRETSDEAESRVDYLADRLGMTREHVTNMVLRMREEGLLADHTDLTARIQVGETSNRSMTVLHRYLRLEKFLLNELEEQTEVNYRELNDRAVRTGLKTATVRQIKTLVLFWILSGDYRKHYNPDDERVTLERIVTPEIHRGHYLKRKALAEFIISLLYEKSRTADRGMKDEALVNFSVKELQQAFNQPIDQLAAPFDATTEDIQHALMYLTRISAMTIEGGFLVSWHAMQLKRLERDNRIQYKNEDYRMLNDFYRQRIQQIHIVGEYAHLMVRDYEEALRFVGDYFQMDYRGFLNKYFKGNRQGEINRNITPEKYERLFGALSATQRQIVDDDQSRNIVVAAGPGSGKTRLLVHKLASLLMLEDVKHEQLLMLTFSRAAATEFKRRLLELIGNAAYFINMKTFHSYCFELLGKRGNPEETPNVVREAVRLIEAGEAEPGYITRSVLVIDEAQDMDDDEKALVEALISKNDGIRVIAVGDDDQNIYAFRGSDSAHMMSLLKGDQSRLYEMTENYRSIQAIVTLANAFVKNMRHRVKQTPIRAVQADVGEVCITEHAFPEMETPLVNQLIKNNQEGSRCVLTGTNAEAARITGLLLARGISARLIQSNDEFDLTCLAEIRFFLRETQSTSQVIDSKTWESAREALRVKYAKSEALPLCLTMLERFEQTNRSKYRNDFLNFLLESRLEDFAETTGSTVTVSTFHKAKGREFDHVYLMLRNGVLDDDEALRRIYVGITRARNSLWIHTNRPFPAPKNLPGIRRETDSHAWEEPEEILLQLSHRDVHLNAFLGKSRRISTVRSGEKLILKGEWLHSATEDHFPLVHLSAACREQLEDFRKRGYFVNHGAVRFVVAWKGKEETGETWIILPDLYLKKEEKTGRVEK